MKLNVKLINKYSQTLLLVNIKQRTLIRHKKHINKLQAHIDHMPHKPQPHNAMQHKASAEHRVISIKFKSVTVMKYESLF